MWDQLNDRVDHNVTLTAIRSGLVGCLASIERQLALNGFA